MWQFNRKTISVTKVPLQAFECKMLFLMFVNLLCELVRTLMVPENVLVPTIIYQSKQFLTILKVKRGK